MAVDDIINAMSAANANLVYQPAAGVEAVVTSTAMDSVGQQPEKFDGTNSAIHRISQSVQPNIINSKIGVTNTVYYRNVAQGVGLYGAYSAIQTK